jgi:hypothetical protein
VTTSKDAVIILVEASESIFEPVPENNGKSAFYTILETALLFQKKKIVTASKDLVGIVVYNTVRAIYHCITIHSNASLPGGEQVCQERRLGTRLHPPRPCASCRRAYPTTQGTAQEYHTRLFCFLDHR